MKKIAIIGAGMAGLTAAHFLNGYAGVTVFEKSKGPGGRLSTRHHGSFAFDHGAQFFTSKTDEFTRFIRPFIEKGIITRWQPQQHVPQRIRLFTILFNCGRAFGFLPMPRESSFNSVFLRMNSRCIFARSSMTFL